jgi:WD40 repeat protein
VRAHSRAINALAFDPDNHLLASAGIDQTIRLWRMPTGAPLGAIRTGNEDVEGLAFTGAGEALVSTGPGGRIRLWDPMKRALRATMEGSGRILALAVSPDGRTVATAWSDQRIELGDPLRARGRRTLRQPGSPALALAFSRDGRVLASAGAGTEIAVWDLASGHRLRTIDGHGATVLSLAFGADRMVASADRDGSVVLSDAARSVDGGLPWTARVGDVLGLALDPVGRRLVAAGPAGVSTLGPGRDQMDQLAGEQADIVAVSRDGARVASFVQATGRIQLWDTRGRRSLGILPTRSETVTSMAFDAPGHLLAVGDERQEVGVTIWSTEGLRQTAMHPTGGMVTSVALRPDGGAVAWGEQRGVLLGDVGGGRLIGPLQSGLTADHLSFSGDGRLLVSDDRGTANVWDAASGRLVAALPTDGSFISSLTLDGDGQLLAAGVEPTGAGRGQVVLWDVAGRSRIGSFSGREGGLTSLVIGDDGRLAAGWSGGRTVVWEVNAETWRRRLCGMRGRELTEAEWKDLVPRRSQPRICG